jgi:hypothetical protein
MNTLLYPILARNVVIDSTCRIMPLEALPRSTKAVVITETRRLSSNKNNIRCLQKCTLMVNKV